MHSPRASSQVLPSLNSLTGSCHALLPLNSLMVSCLALLSQHSPMVDYHALAYPPAQLQGELLHPAAVPSLHSLIASRRSSHSLMVSFQALSSLNSLMASRHSPCTASG